MTTVQETPSISEVLYEYRKEKGLTKAAMYRALGVSAVTYDTWEGGVYTPGDEYAEILADVLDLELREVVWMLYHDRLRPGLVVPLSLDLGRRVSTLCKAELPTVRAHKTTDWDYRPIDPPSTGGQIAA